MTLPPNLCCCCGVSAVRSSFVQKSATTSTSSFVSAGRNDTSWYICSSDGVATE